MDHPNDKPVTVELTQAQWSEVIDALILWEEGFLDDGDDAAADATHVMINEMSARLAESGWTP